jgi:hypothetical protein
MVLIALQQPQLMSYQLIGDSLLLRFAEQILYQDAQIGKPTYREAEKFHIIQGPAEIPDDFAKQL